MGGLQLLSHAGLALHGSYLLAEVALEGAAGGAAASYGEDRLALQVLEAEGEAAVEGDGGYHAAQDARGGLEGGGRGQLVEAGGGEAGRGQGYDQAEEGFPEEGAGVDEEQDRGEC